MDWTIGPPGVSVGGPLNNARKNDMNNAMNGIMAHRGALTR